MQPGALDRQPHAVHPCKTVKEFILYFSSQMGTRSFKFVHPAGKSTFHCLSELNFWITYICDAEHCGATYAIPVSDIKIRNTVLRLLGDLETFGSRKSRAFTLFLLLMIIHASSCTRPFLTRKADLKTSIISSTS